MSGHEEPSRSHDAERRFLVGLAKLTRETGIGICGCGCCGSPYLSRMTPDELADKRAGYAKADHVQWVSPSDKFAWDEYSDIIVRED